MAAPQQQGQGQEQHGVEGADEAQPGQQHAFSGEAGGGLQLLHAVEGGLGPLAHRQGHQEGEQGGGDPQVRPPEHRHQHHQGEHPSLLLDIPGLPPHELTQGQGGLGEPGQEGRLPHRGRRGEAGRQLFLEPSVHGDSSSRKASLHQASSLAHFR